MEIGFSAYSGADFLVFYGLLLIAALVASWWIPDRLRPEGKAASEINAEQFAFLSGGPARFADSVVSALVARGAMRVEANKLVSTARHEGETSAERRLLRNYGGYGWNEILRTLAGDAHVAELQLEKQGLLIPHDERMKLRLMSAAPLLVLAAIGAFRLFAGMAEYEPVGFLFVLLLITLGFALLRVWKFNPRTHAGDAALDDARAAQARLRSAPRQSEVGFAVALYGPVVLVGTPYEPLHAMRQPQPGTDGSGGCGSDGGGDGGGGCGGGGCGGCGG